MPGGVAGVQSIGTAPLCRFPLSIIVRLQALYFGVDERGQLFGISEQFGLHFVKSGDINQLEGHVTLVDKA